MAFSDNACTIPKTITDTPPKAGEVPVNISLGIYLIDIIELDEIKESFKLKAGYYIWKFVVPLCFIVLMASSVFWLDPESFGPQIGISTASVFTLVTFLLGLRQGLPEVAYLTRMDGLVLAATILVFASFGEVVYVSRLVKAQRSELARRIDFYASFEI